MFVLVLTKLPQGQTVLEYALVLPNEIFSYTFKLSTKGCCWCFKHREEANPLVQTHRWYIHDLATQTRDTQRFSPTS